MSGFLFHTPLASVGVRGGEFHLIRTDSMAEHDENEEKMTSGQGSEGARRNSEGKYSKSLTVMVIIEGGEDISIMDILKVVKKECGVVEGCRVRGPGRLEITMETTNGKEKLMDGIKHKKATIVGKEMDANEMVVSFLNLPVYIEDQEIIDRLKEWGVRPVSAIRRRMWPGTEVVDGTRFLKVKFNDEVRSLPYSTKFTTIEGVEHFRVIHDRQERVCRLCVKPGHIYKECPEFKCYRCHKQGHYARECNAEGDHQQGGEGESQEMPDRVGERQTREGGSEAEGTETEESDGGENGDEEQMDEDGEQDGEEEDEAAADGTPMEAGGEKEREEIGSSLDSVLREIEEKKMENGAVEERKGEGKNGDKSGKTTGGHKDGTAGTGGVAGVGYGGSEWVVSDITDSDGDHLEKVATTRKRPLGRKDVKRQGKVKKNAK